MALKRGSNGEEVKALQENLQKLGFPLAADGIFGDDTHNTVITVQTIWGYDVDGIAGPATVKLVEDQAGYGWNLEAARKAFGKPAV
jgi:peptidoglycan hydrolase-like protein with peptidoglycan-binding domain